ncbi:MAG TPA: phosphonoacetaldehyde reductase [Candidatus Limnocylindria bacterium]
MTDRRAQAVHNPVRTVFGNGAVDAAREAVANRRCVVITTEGMVARGTLGRLEAVLGPSSPVVSTFTDVVPNPTIASCTTAFEAVRDADAEVLVALGGGSAIDTTKAVAAQVAHASVPGWLAGHLRDAVPFGPDAATPRIVAVPTTAGTGSEVTMWATIWDEQQPGKHSVSHPSLYPETAILDPELTLSVPRATTVASALDALSHAMEAIWNRAASPESDAYAVRAIGLIPGALRAALATPDDISPREALLSGSLAAGLAISSTRTALAHSISYPLTAEMGLPHGVACSMTLPELLLAVAERVPERSDLIVEALGRRSVEEAASGLRDLLAASGADDVVRHHVSTVAELENLAGGFIAPGRAENFVLDVDQAWAAAILRRSAAAAGVG